MRRVGKYTKKTSVRSAKFGTNKYFLWFRNLKRWQKILIIVGPILAILVLIPLLTYLYFARDIADQERLMNRNNTGIVLMDRSGEIIYQTGRAKHREMIPLDKISKSAKDALLASEDKNFYDHGGVSFTSMIGALYANVVTGGKNFGGSTLTQQLAKNTLLTSQKSFLRKYQELSVAIAIERTYTKDEILAMYLNSVYYGENAFGIEDAAEVYFGKKPIDLDLAESAMLIGVLPAPSAYSPISGSKKYAKERQETVLKRMVNNKMITQAEKDAATTQDLAYASQKSPSDESPAPHFVEMVMADLSDRYGEEKVSRSGFQVKTSLDLGLQRQLQQSISQNMPLVRLNGGSNAGAVAIDPATGGIRALIGSYDWNDEAFGKVNIVTAKRQPGSSFKPLYYAEALAEGVINPATILEDKPTDFNGYQPKNALRNYNGDVSVRRALSWSLNIPAVKVMQRLGVEKSVAAAQRMGVTTLDDNQEYGLSLALGSAEAKLLDMTHAYAGFANSGNQSTIRYVEEIKSKFDEQVPVDRPKAKQVISEAGAYLISNILSDDGARAGMFGGSLTVPGKKVAVKTGTTDENRDAWTIGYTPQLALGVWAGNNDNKQMSSGGGTVAGPIWRSVMSQALPVQNGDPFTRPSGVVERDVCYGVGKLAPSSGENTYKEVFLSSALPSFGCDVKKKEEEVKKPEDKKPKKKPETSTKPTTPLQSSDSPGLGDDADDAGDEDAGDTQDPVDPSNPDMPPPGSGDDPVGSDTAEGGA
ncbi:penicillin-binding protein [Candidatus Saccharibacteria bacterium]|jgi:penicillin-binding protein 1A|nr:penicillin-binding protein [Candidatus Saccharibacteria bacterium]